MLDQDRPIVKQPTGGGDVEERGVGMGMEVMVVMMVVVVMTNMIAGGVVVMAAAAPPIVGRPIAPGLREGRGARGGGRGDEEKPSCGGSKHLGDVHQDT